MNFLDPVKNFAKCTLASGIDNSATSITLASGNGALLPAPATDGAFNAVVWNSTDYADPADDANREIVRVTARSTDTLTVARAQEGTSAVAHNTSGKTYKLALIQTAKTITDIDAYLDPAGMYGTGADGDVTISADTNLSRDMYYNNLTINSGKKLYLKGYRIFVKGTLTNNGTIDAETYGGSLLPGAGWDGASGPTTGQSSSAAQPLWGGKGGTGKNGGAGGDVAFSAERAKISANLLFRGIFTDNGSGWYYFIPPMGGSGGGGGGECAGWSGSGGNGGGRVNIFAHTFNNAGTIKANGANGADGGGASPYLGGGGGGGGIICIVYRLNIAQGTLQVNGGAGGAGNIAGNNGAAGSAGYTYVIQY